MINLTVKTLDSHNYQFSVEDDITVEQFKRHIAETVNVPAETQRIIYLGRVLQDSSKLNDYNVDGKVLHLVQRPPPSANPPSSQSSRSSSPRPQSRVFRRLDHGNTMFLGSVAFPTNFMDSQGIVPPPPTHSHAGSRLNVAKRMLRKAEQVITQLENPNRSTEPQQEDPQEEATPVIEARVIVPSNSSEPLDEAAIFSAVQDHFGGSRNSSGIETSEQAGTSGNASADQSSEQQEGPSATETSRPFPENARRTTSMAELLTKLSQLQLRFTPFLERYQNFMRDDPVVPQEEVRTVQTELTRVSEVMHFLSHAYHSLSDILIRVRTPPPRPLLCRPILIQHSAVLQTGIPIQVEAQINLTNDSRPPGVPTSAQPATPTSNGAGGTPAPTATPQPFPSQGVPLISHVRVPIPLEIRGMMPSVQSQSISGGVPLVLPTTSIGRTTGASTQEQQQQQQQGSTDTPSPTASPQQRVATGGQTGGATPGNGSNPEVEFIMEVTPEGITIDSLETALIGPNQADDLLRGALNAQQTPNLIQSIMQVAGQLINRRGPTGGADIQAAPAATNQREQSSSAAPTSATPLAPTPPGQNSQARGNNQTNPTSSTQTRSTARPHVHLQQQTMQGGFDSFLPCNSHHLSRRRLQNAAVQREQTPSRPNQPAFDAAQEATTQLNSLMHSILNSLRNTQQMRRGSGSAGAGGPRVQSQSESTADPSDAPPTGSTGSGEGSTQRVPTAPPADQLPMFMAGNLSELMSRGPTLAQILQQLPLDDSYVPGESVITDFIMLISRNLTIGDIISLNGGNIAPISRMALEIQHFFLTTVMNNSRSREAADTAVERILTEMQPLFTTLSEIPIRDDIDIEASVRRLLRDKLPPIFQLCSRLADQPQNVRLVCDLFVSTLKEFCALALHACADGLRGVDRIFEVVATRYMQGIPADLQEWTLRNSRSHMRQLMSNLNVSATNLEPYIVRGTDQTPEAMVLQTKEDEDKQSEELMETEDTTEVPSKDSSPSPSRIQLEEEAPEPLPNVVIGSEPWHNQVPADWVPLIARDAQRQKKQHSQPPFSDAYLAGMPSKRRKIVHANKGRQGIPLPQIISESVRKAVTATGLTAVAPLEVVSQAAGSSTDIQAAYRGLLRSSVQPGLKNNVDFTPERFPHATDYFGTL